MKGNIKSRFCACVLSAALILGMAPLSNAEAAGGDEISTSTWQTCTTYDGKNVEGQNYFRWSSPIDSYLTTCDDGRLMRVQYVGSIGKVVAEYYNSDYELQDMKVIDEELPIFGGFYKTDSNYFLITGQENMDELKDVEVYRITKYDKNWKKIAVAGLKECNTVVPFAAGNARMDTAGDYLFIRTSHKMYADDNGTNHQANVTIQVDMNTMEITDSYTKVMNSSYGYVSHSFNQFIKVENNHIVAVDHGDAYPRSIVLLEYQTNVSTGTFVPSYNTPCKSTNILRFPGTVGNNTTGASVGGFEISPSAYLIAGNSVVQDDENVSRATRNVFVAAVDKNTKEVAMNWLTDYVEGDGTTSTPQMVKINDSSYMVLWSRNNTVYYTLIGGDGNQTTQTYEMTGNLSDCVPVVTNNKLVWYTWDDETITFYEIGLNDLSQTQTKVIENGHDYEQSGLEGGIATLACKHCGETTTLQVATSMSVLWNENGGNSYSYYFNNKKDVGGELYYWVQFNPGDADRELEVIVENPEVLSCTPTGSLMGKFTALKPGKTTVTIRPKYNPELSRTYTIMVNGDLEVSSFTADKESPQQVGTEVNLGAEAVGGSWSYTYKFYEKDAEGKENVIQDYSNKATCTWTPETIGDRTLYVDVKDSNGTVVTKSMEYTINALALQASDFEFNQPENLAFDGTTKTVGITAKDGITGIGAITVKYYDSDGVQLAGAPTKVGTYTVKIDVSAGTKYGAAKDLTDAAWTFTIEKATEVPNKPEASMEVSHGLGTIGKVELPGNWKWTEESADTALKAGESVSATAEYIGADKDNYENLTYNITLKADEHKGGTATCSSKAVCTICNNEYGELNASNHTGNTEVKDTKAATCTEKGYTGDTYCKDCGAKLKDGEETEALGHEFGDWETITSPNCSDKGSKKRVCMVCGYIETQDIDALGHDWEDEYTVDKEPTCTEEGSKSIHCKNCDAVKESTAIPAAGHDFKDYKSNGDATCTEDGTKTAKCEKCGAVDTISDIGSKLGHQYGEYTSNNDATCTKDGTKTAVCERCGESNTVTDEGTKLPHTGGTATCASPAICEVCGTPYGDVDPDNHVGGTELRNQKATTCAEEGYTGDVCCKGCGSVLTQGTTIAKTAHEFGEWEVVKSPGCEDKGSKARVCVNCGFTETEDVDETGHDWETEYTVDKAATCTEPGSRSIHCKNCDVTKDSESIPALGHSFTNYVSDGNATCKEDGTKTAKCDRCDATDTIVDPGTKTNEHTGGTATCIELAKCEVCGVSYGELDSTNHAGKTETRNAKDATCTEKGYSGDVYCLDCNTLIEKGHDINALGHTFGEWKTITSPNCLDKGSKQRVCEICGYSETQDIDASGHDWEDEFTVDKEPTCTEEGSKSIHCKNCDAVKESTAIPATGHDFKNYKSNGDATCTEDGTKTAKCENCDAVDTISDIGSKLGHKGGTATCVSKAVCEVCGEEYGEVDLSNHTGNTEVRNQREATCQADGYTGDEFCKDCGTLLKKGKAVEKLEHKYVDGKCTVCGAEKQNGNNVPATSTASGNNGNDKENKAVKTGDTAPIVSLISVFVLAGLYIVVSLIRRKRF